MVAKSELKFTHLRYDPGNRLIADYIKLRCEVFAANGMDYYSREPDEYDLQPDTQFIIVTDDVGKVYGGRRILVHQPGSDTKLKTEKTVDISLQQMLWHLDLKTLCYAELASLCLAPEVQGMGLAKDMYAESFKALKELGVDFFVAETVPKNLARFMKAAIDSGALQLSPMRVILVAGLPEGERFRFVQDAPLMLENKVAMTDAKAQLYASAEVNATTSPEINWALKVQDDKHKLYTLTTAFSNDGDMDFRCIASFHAPEKLPLLSPEMRSAAIGEPMDEVTLKKLIESRERLIQSRQPHVTGQ